MNINDIWIFKTNIQTEADKLYIEGILNADNKITKTTIDLQDVDCVLRVVSNALCAAEIIATVKSQGFECTELQ
ncbi:hypothetical protein [Ferruginibacter sp.]